MTSTVPLMFEVIHLDDKICSFQIIALATINDDNQFFFYNNVDTVSNEPHVYGVEFEDNLLVSEEVYARIAFSNPKLR